MLRDMLVRGMAALVGQFLEKWEGFKTKNKVKTCPLKRAGFLFSQFLSGFLGKYFELRIATPSCVKIALYIVNAG
jgi:hypothetical protein